MPAKTEHSTGSEEYEEKVQEIVTEIQRHFPTFGGIRKGDGFNPLVTWLEGKPASFAAGVGVADVVRFVLERSRT